MHKILVFVASENFVSWANKWNKNRWLSRVRKSFVCVVLSELSVKLCVKLCLNIRRFRQFLKVVRLGCEIQWKEMLASGLRDFKGFSAKMRVEIEFTCFKLKTLESFWWNIKKVECLHFSAKLQWVMLSAGRAQERVWLAKSSSSFSAVKFCTSAPFKTLHSAFVFLKKIRKKNTDVFFKCIFHQNTIFYSFRIGRFVFLTIKQIENPRFLPIYRKYKVTKNRSNSSTQSDYYCMRENAYNIILCGRRKTPFSSDKYLKKKVTRSYILVEVFPVLSVHVLKYV